MVEDVRNPFAIRDGKAVMIEDLDYESERGLKCQCKCPNCKGDFMAKMGDVRIHHFSHTKDACDDVLSYISGLYAHIQQALETDTPFYVPALVVSYNLPYNSILNETNVGTHTKIIRENSNTTNKLTVSEGQHILFKNVELCCDDKNHIQALELTYMDRKIAIKVRPPDTICKTSTVSKHKDMATLVLDFANDTDRIQSMNTKAFKEYLLSDKPDKYWIYNPKIKEVYPQIISQSEKAYKESLERQKKYEEERKAVNQQQVVQYEIPDWSYNEKREVKSVAAKEKHISGYEQVKDKPFEQNNYQIRDSFDIRWVKCKLCGEIKPAKEFSSYGGSNSMNFGECYSCRK
ncbi:MAG: hypothetical protein LBR70_03540 [Lactobacillaceae bacterium]|nr:hypothetical protein [Lactobacillaceae bacterium]